MQRPQRVLDDAILERVERDDDQARAGAQPLRRRRDEAIQIVELAVHPDPQRLKGARRRIDARRPAPGNRPADDGRQAACRVHRPVLPRRDQRARDPPREALLAVLEDGVGELALGRAGDEVRRRLAGRAIHPHVQRLVALKAEAAARRVELHRGHAEIGERAVDLRDAARVEHVVERTVVGVDQLHAVGPRGERVGVAIQADEARRARFEKRARVAAEADGAVDEQAAATRLQELERFGGHDRNVGLRHQMPNCASARASSSVKGSRCIFVSKRSWFHTSR